jgi:hypothetical protein
MKNITSLFLFLLVIHVSMGQDTTSAKTSVEVQRIVKSDKVGIIRGYSLGMDMSMIKETEDAVLQGKGDDYLIYKIEFDTNEFADITYTFDKNNKLISIGVTFIENINSKKEEQIIDDFQDYFNRRYGAFTVNKKEDEVWKSSEGYIIEMGDASEENSNEMEVEIEFYKPE